jgi:hypothetical protein
VDECEKRGEVGGVKRRPSCQTRDSVAEVMGQKWRDGAEVIAEDAQRRRTRFLHLSTSTGAASKIGSYARLSSDQAAIPSDRIGTFGPLRAGKSGLSGRNDLGFGAGGMGASLVWRRPEQGGRAEARPYTGFIDKPERSNCAGRCAKGMEFKRRLRLIDQAVMNRVEGELEAVGDAELVENVVKVVFNGLFADEEFLADFFIAKTLGDKLHDFFFAIAEQGLFAARAGFGRLGEGLHDLGGHAVVKPNFAGVDAMDALYKQISGGLFEDDAACAEAHGSDDVTIVFRSGEDDDASR